MRQGRSVLALLAFSCLVGCGSRGSLQAEMTQLLARQAKDWNRGDIAAFMQAYWKSEELTFSSGGQTRIGWDETLKRYQERYPTVEHMGVLSFTLERVQSLGAGAALVLGRWDLKRSVGDIGGNFSLVLRRIGSEWRIVHDHTSVTPTGEP